MRTAPTADLVAAVLDGSLDGAFVAGPIEHADLICDERLPRGTRTGQSARRWTSLAELRAGTPGQARPRSPSAPAAPIASGWSRSLSSSGWPSAARFELGTLDGMIGGAAADMGVTLLPRAVVDASAMKGNVSIHTLKPDSCPCRGRCSSSAAAGHQYSALSGFVSCPTKADDVIAASSHQRRSATTAQIASTTPNGQAPCRKP